MLVAALGEQGEGAAHQLANPDVEAGPYVLLEVSDTGVGMDEDTLRRIFEREGFAVAGADTLDGGRGSDVLVGGNGDDTLNGGEESDLLEGDAGADIYVFAGNNGNDRIADFTGGSDRIDFTAYDVSDVSDFNIDQVALNTVISGYDGEGNTVTLENFQ